jgi:hypothetical protein
VLSRCDYASRASVNLDSLHFAPVRKKRDGNQTPSNIRPRISSVRMSQSRGDEHEDENAAGREGMGSMLVPKSYSWKSARARLPPSRQVVHTLRSPKTWALFGVVAVLVLLWRSMGSAAGEMQRYGDNRADCTRAPTSDQKPGSTAGAPRNRPCI